MSFWFCSYELPPPSRSRENNVNIFDPNYKTPFYNYQPNPQSTPVNTFNDQFGYQVVPIYIPNEGYRYFVVVPVDKWHFLNSNLIESGHKSQEQKYDKYDKYNGRYNAKLKKYKAYEKFIKPQQVGDWILWSVRHYWLLIDGFWVILLILMSKNEHEDLENWT